MVHCKKQNKQQINIQTNVRAGQDWKQNESLQWQSADTDIPSRKAEQWCESRTRLKTTGESAMQ